MPTTAQITSNPDDLAYLSQVSLQIQQEWSNHYPVVKTESLHPCFIGGQSHLVTRRGLKNSNTAAFDCLVSISSRYGIRIIEDRRNKQTKVTHDRRQKIALVVGLLVGISTKQLAFAQNDDLAVPLQQQIESILDLPDSNHSHVGISKDKHANLTTHLIAKRTANGSVRIGTRTVSITPAKQLKMEAILGCLNGNKHSQICATPDAKTIQKIENILFDHLSEFSQKDPQSLKVIKKIAYYYAHYPEVASLLESIQLMNWTLHAQDKDFRAQALIQNQKVQHVDVFFDPYQAAQMIFANRCANTPICTVSPADALLHELLHAKIMLESPEHYAHENTHSIYPVEHEHEVIALENKLYQAMTKTDQLPRPIRSSHAASLVEVDCPVCVASVNAI